MLASILPGVRDFRTPLVTGALYLTVLWLWFGDALVPEADGSSDLEKRLATLLAEYGPTLGLTALAFVAYLIGSILTINSIPIEDLRLPSPALGNLRATTAQWAATTADRLPGYVAVPRNQLAPQIAPDIHDLEDSAAGPPGTEISRIERSSFFRLCVRSVVADRTSLEMRLAQSAAARFDDYDRLQTEAALRLSMVVPLVLIVVTFGLDFGVAWLGLVVPAVLLMQGVNLLAKARLMLVTALINGLMTSPTRDAVYALEENQGLAQPD